MKKKILKYLLWVTVLLFGAGLYSLNADYLAYTATLPEISLVEEEVGDTINKPRHPVAKTSPENYDDLLKDGPADLKTPENVQTKIEYDLNTGFYVVRTRLGEVDLTTPLILTPEEYQDYSFKKSVQEYYRKRNEEEFQKAADDRFNLMDMQFDIGAAERIFGPGGVRVKTQGTAEVTMGLKTTNNKNPSLPERSRKRTFFNFDENVQLDIQAFVGSKVKFNMNYNTETSFDFDSKKLNLAYKGDEDEIIKSLEAGNVSMNTSNSLINGGAALFGMKADMQFGKLRVNALFAQQESESKTVSSKGGVQTTPFEIPVDKYDENRHFFLAHYFRDNYEKSVANLPSVVSGIKINKIEVWITNKQSNYDQSRNIVAFSDLGESDHISNPQFVAQGGKKIPYNGVNTLYQTITQQYPNARDVSKVNQVLSGFVENGADYEKVESARLLKPSEYTLNSQLGYISLKSQLQPDEVLAVAYSFTYSDGLTYQVGEFSVDNASATEDCLYVKLLKGTTMSPQMPFWDLMMKNIYSLGAYSVQKEKFRLDILYQSDTTGTYVNYLPEGNVAKTILLRVLNLDNLDLNGERHADGFFDFVDGYTILSENGKIIFPCVEPFGSYLRKKIGNDAIADKYVYQELYDSTLTVAQQIAEKNKFMLTGEYKASSGADIQLGASNVARGSVRVTAGGATLTENVDYTVDYTSGIVTILNEGVLASNTPVSVSLENQSSYSMQRKTMMGVDLNYMFNPDFTMGATIMHMSEMPLTTKTTMGDESINNTLWGLNMAYKGQSQWLTNMFDKLPLLNLSKPSEIAFNAEFAQLIAGHYENRETGGYSYLDDFESTQSDFNLKDPYPWQLSSVPYDDAAKPLFPEAGKVNNVDYGKNRALLSWYFVDGMFTRKNSSLRPKHITNEQLSNHYVRQVQMDELFPERDAGISESNTLNVLNLAYYPNERGPYNLDAENINPDGTLQYPEKRFGGMMRKVDQSNFETANIEFIEFWMLDPFIYDEQAEGGDLYFNLGEVSEDILKDEKKFFENGLPIDGSTSKIDSTIWGKVPRQQSTVYAFDNTAGARDVQDVGLNGLSSEEEKNYPSYKEYLDKLRIKLNAATIAEMENDPLQMSPFFNPSGDKFHYYRGSDWDRQEADILTRYKYYNGTEGNSKDINQSNEKYSTSSRTTPDVEDLNQDNTLSENEKYFEYKVSIRPQDTIVGTNYIVDKRNTRVKLANGSWDNVTWYQFKIPVKKYGRRVGSINDFKTIRFMRMYMTGFKKPVVLRFGTLQLVRGEWRTYEQDLSDPKMPPMVSGTMDVSSVNIEENSDRDPVNYVLPPGVSRVLDPSQPQVRQQNEQSLSLKVNDLAPLDARAVYKNTNYDLRQYKRMQLYTHAEAFKYDLTNLENNDMSIFIRLGSDYRNNYYEYEVPLKLTQHHNNSPEDVWPAENFLNFRFKVLTDLKLKRNKAKREGQSGVTFQQVYSDYDPDNNRNKISVKGNPSLSEVKTIMIGIRNNSKDVKSAEVWVNELRLTDFNEEGGWAANANLNVALSDLGTVNVGGRIETSGFGGLDQSLTERRLEDLKQYNIVTNIEFGKFFPEKAKVSIPFYYAYSRETNDPKYNPLDQDVKLKDALKSAETKQDKDSITKLSQDKIVAKSIAFNNVHVDIRSKNPMPYDPANFTLGYSYSVSDNLNPETEYETTKDYQANFAYTYTPYVKPFKPFNKKIKKKNAYNAFAKQLSFNLAPSINFQSVMTRNYYEMKLRDLTGLTMGVENDLPVSFSQNFYWDRAFSLNWAFTNSLNITFSSGTNARIDEPYVQVNKKLEPDKFKLWKDSVKRSIADFGTPMKYDQQFQVTWKLPFNHIKALNWITASTTYNAIYNWERGAAAISEDLEFGNTIKNQAQYDIQGSMNFVGLYNKNKFLKKVNQRFSGTRTSSAAKKNKEKEKKPIKKLEKEITLNTDSGTVVKHSMMTKKLRIMARGADGKLYAIKFKPINKEEVMITTKDTAKLKLTIYPGPSSTETLFTDVAEYGSRFLMMVRRLNLQYMHSEGMMLPGFKPEVGDMLGQRKTSFGFTPGVGFAFGAVNRSYIERASERGWLLDNPENNLNPAIMTMTENINLRANLEPIPGLNIDLTALRNDTRNTEIQFMYQGMPEVRGGNFTMTTIALGSRFGGVGNMKNNYASKAFDKFLSYREVIANRMEKAYSGMKYPDNGFIHEGGWGGQTYDPGANKQNAVNMNSPEVLIPAFIAAYTGKDPDKISFSPFPSLKSLLPNWRLTYNGLSKIPAIKKYFKNIVFNHQYQSNYSVGSYSSYANWVDAGDGLGFMPSVQNNRPMPSSRYDIATVSITEAFNPLLGLDATMVNNLTLRGDFSTTRTLNLNTTSYQIVEALSNTMTVGLGYKYVEFNKVLKMRKSKDFSNDLDVRLDFSLTKMQSLIRKVEDGFTQATSGNIAKTIQFSADYALSRALSVRAFYDIQINNPLISSAAFPTTNSNYGISFRFSLAQ